MICPSCGSETTSPFACGRCEWKFNLECPYCGTEISEEWFIEEIDRSLVNVVVNENRANTSNRRGFFRRNIKEYK